MPEVHPLALTMGLACLTPGLLVAAFLAYDAARRRTGPRPRHWLRVRLGWGHGVEELSRRLGVAVAELRGHRVAYREHRIPKRSGGTRRLLIPDPATMALQRRILRRLLAKLHAHPAACGFERGRGIVANARPHVGKAVVLKLDVHDFFPSVPATRVERYFRRIGWDEHAARLLTGLVTAEGGLPQGAPTSPRLSNLVLFDLDVKLAAMARKRRADYTRYADDLTFSFARDHGKRVRGTVQLVRRLLKANGLALHGDKTRVLRRHQRQTVTGLVVNDRVNLPRSTRRRLRAALHRRRTGGTATLTDDQLAGWSGLLGMIERQRAEGEARP